ncbi:UNVERIFIED_CONTAM: hypothetical protein Slati_3465700 [Sesamum latifolium]|uniref:Reverse transcriptase domain-containing protein n=1 Tax=Sesamum latifolium TaxID=2727402 RepID=A0AAW2UGP7_9LAMI
MILRLATRLEQNMLHQRAKIAWMKGGDQCSPIFFRKVAKRRSSKRVFQITDYGGQVITDQQGVTNEFIAYYQTLLAGERRHRVIDLCYLRPWARHILSEAEALTLVQPVTPSEIKHAVFDIDEVKALGPDGYSLGFFKAAWPVVGEEVTRAIMEFFRTGRLLKQVNSTLISLIPKVNTPTVVAEFRPISCCNVLYKIITKVIVQRMRGVLDKLISPSQNAFVPGRSIGDNILLAQELFHGYNQQNLPPRCALKVDLRKAYDTVEWDFLGAVLTLFGFPAQFISWIEECVTTPSFSVSLNGSPHGFFRGARGVTAGGPYVPIPVCTCYGELIRLPFIFLNEALWCLRISLDFTLILRRAILSSLDRPPLIGIHSFLFWDIRKVAFPSGRVQLIKSVLTALQVYWAMAFILPKTIIREIEKRLHSFLWKECAGVGYAKVSWQQTFVESNRGRSLLDLGGLDHSLLIAGYLYLDGTSFSSAAAYDVFHPPGPKVEWSSLLVGSLKIPRHRFILWLAILERLSILDKPWLQHLGTDCVLCRVSTPETHYHLFFSCPFALECLHEIQATVTFHWPYSSWDTAIRWASSRWRGKHVVNASYKALLASLVYHLWEERNRRIFQQTERTPVVIARTIVSEIRDLIISKHMVHSVSMRGLYRLWRIPWPVEGDAHT